MNFASLRLSSIPERRSWATKVCDLRLSFWPLRFSGKYIRAYGLSSGPTVITTLFMLPDIFILRLSDYQVAMSSLVSEKVRGARFQGIYKYKFENGIIF